MKNSNFDYQKAFFIIDSNHLKDVKSEMFGFCLLDGLVIETLEELQNQEPSSEGCYVYVNRTDKSIIIKQDFVGCYGIYLYKHGDYFALSNSFMYLVDYLKSKKPITFNYKFPSSSDYINGYNNTHFCSSL